MTIPSGINKQLRIDVEMCFQWNIASLKKCLEILKDLCETEKLLPKKQLREEKRIQHKQFCKREGERVEVNCGLVWFGLYAVEVSLSWRITSTGKRGRTRHGQFESSLTD